MNRKTEQGNFVSEWFGHRMFPAVVGSEASLNDQLHQHCPFLSQSTGESRTCIKSDTSKGVCSISSASNGIRQDWVVCPYRAFDGELMSMITTRLYGSADAFNIFAAPSLSRAEEQNRVLELLESNQRVLVYFDQKLGGEISVSSTARSPEIAFDTTFVEITRREHGLALGSYAIMEIQTMDFHGSYRKVVDNLQSALKLHESDFPQQVQANQKWLAERIEGPNIANVFKRTFWQMMFKFEMANSPGCVGVALSIPEAVWDSWQKFLASPELKANADETFTLRPDGDKTPLSSWIYIFDFDESSPITPSPMRVKKVVRTNASSFAHFALEESPRDAMQQLKIGIYPVLRARLQKFWQMEVGIPSPDLGVSTVSIEEDKRPIDEITKEP